MRLRLTELGNHWRASSRDGKAKSQKELCFDNNVRSTEYRVGIERVYALRVLHIVYINHLRRPLGLDLRRPLGLDLRHLLPLRRLETESWPLPRFLFSLFWASP